MKITEPLAHELQLGEKLNDSVQQNRRCDFALMLSMLNDDVREFSQFMLPHSDVEPVITDDDRLRKVFMLPKAAKLAPDNVQQLDELNQASLALAHQLSTIRLQNALTPKPLAIRDDKLFIDNDILNNTSVHCQRRYQQHKHHGEAAPTSVPYDFNAAGWLNAIKQAKAQHEIEAMH